MAETSSGVYSLSPILTFDAAAGFDDLVGHELDVALDFGVLKLAADEALDLKDGVVGVDDGLALGDLADEALAVLLTATMDGVVRPPSALAMMVGWPPSMTAMAELVVPRSIPMILPMKWSLRLRDQRAFRTLS
jgi:hypothetical protein